MKIIKRNQIIIFVLALMLITAGYLNYTAGNTNTIQTSDTAGNTIASIGDAQLVSSNSIIENIVTESNIVSNEVPASNTIETASKNVENVNEYFTNSKLQRETMYSQMLESFQKILENPNISEEQKTAATKEIAQINQVKNAIMITENLLETKGFAEAVIFVNSDSISVIIGEETLQPEQIAQIQNIVSRELNADIDNIHISCK